MAFCPSSKSGGAFRGRNRGMYCAGRDDRVKHLINGLLDAVKLALANGLMQNPFQLRLDFNHHKLSNQYNPLKSGNRNMNNGARRHPLGGRQQHPENRTIRIDLVVRHTNDNKTELKLAQDLLVFQVAVDRNENVEFIFCIA